MSRPSVTIVFLVFNRREELRTSLNRMLSASDYRGRVDVIVVDNASTDGSADMVSDEFPEVRVMQHAKNVGVSGWNMGLAAARGDYVLALDDDCYLPPDGLSRAVAAAEAHDADLVSFRVVSTRDPTHVFTDEYRTGLFTFWGCAVLMRRRVIEELGGYDPEIFVWGNELEFMLRFFDRGMRHLHLPEVAARHMKSLAWGKAIGWQPYRVNASRFAYIAAKLLRRRDAVEALVAILALRVRDALRVHPGALTAIPAILREFVHGLRHRQPVRNPELSRFYRRNFVSFASPWWFSRRPRELIRGDPPTRWHQFFERRAALYPDRARTLDFGSPGSGPAGSAAELP
jgi:GT2 family glycosyltransferase